MTYHETETPATSSTPKKPSLLSFASAVATVRNMNLAHQTGTMNIDKSLYDFLISNVDSDMRTVEFGSGVSTFAFENSGSHTAYEQNNRQAARLAHRGAEFCPLNAHGWYDIQTIDRSGVSIVLVDGPWRGDRANGLMDILSFVGPQTILIVDDYVREQALLNKLVRAHPFRTFQLIDRWCLMLPAERLT